MRVFAVLFALAAGLLAIVGFAGTSQVTTGVGVIGVAAVAGIIARLCQASDHASREAVRSAAILVELAKIRSELDIVKRVQAHAHNIEVP